MATALVTQIAYAVQTLFDPAGTAGRLVDLGKLANYGLLTSFTPGYLFTAGVNGTWYDPSDINLTWRRNLLTYSEQFDNAVWVKQSGLVSVTPNAAIAPDGTMTADLAAWSGVASLYQGFTGNIGTTYSGFVYVKGTPGETISIWLDAGSGLFRTRFTLDGTWQRIGGSATQSLNTLLNFAIRKADAGDTATNVYIWGAQLEQGSTATPYQRITDGIQDYLQYQAQPVLFQDAAGTTPVTAVEQPVGLMLDKSKGLVLGPELVTTGDFSSGTTGWSVSGTGAQISVAGGVATVANGSANEASLLLPALTAGKWYFLSADISAVSGTSSIYFVPPSGSQISNVPKTTAGKLQGYFYSGTTGTGSRIAVGNATAGAYFSIDNISVRELPGNHAFNSSGNSANFPVLSARYNLLTKSEDLTDATVWNYKINSTAVDYQTVNFSGIGRFGRATGLATGVQYTYSVEVKAGTKTGTVQLEDSNNAGTWTPITLTNNWQRLIISYTPTATPYISVASTDGNSGTVLVRNWDMRVANDALNQPAYQRVNTSTDYDTVGFKPYLRFNGTNQWLQTNSIDFNYGDKMFVCAGVRKLSDAATGILSELSATTDTNNGSFFLLAPSQGATASYRTRSKGTASVDLEIISGYPAPITNVLSFTGNISAPSTTIRVNGSQVTYSTTTQGTGNYGNYPLYIGARGGSALWFNGRLYGMVVAGKQASAAEITSTETYINQKTGAY